MENSITIFWKYEMKVVYTMLKIFEQKTATHEN
jgi:hypothetical protein